MKLCPNCGTQNADQFMQCKACGSVLPASAPQPVYSGTAGYVPPAYQQSPVTSAVGWLGWTLLCGFLPIVGPIIMMFAPDDPSAKNFGKAMLVLQIIFGIIGAIFSSTVIALLRYSLGI